LIRYNIARSIRIKFNKQPGDGEHEYDRKQI
jgi:hypothetical protein